MKLRGYLTLGVIGAALVVGDPIQRTLVAGLARLFPSRRDAILTAWIRMYARIMLGLARIVGGARIQDPPSIPGGPGVLVLMNHQSVLDIPLVVQSVTPLHPRIVTRERYGRGKPLISHMVRLYQYPQVEPRATVRGHLKTIAEAVRESPVPIALYPEGTRTRDGSLGAFRELGLRAILGARQWTVYLLVNDGFWRAAHLPDFVANVSSVVSRSAVLGPFQAPAPGTDPGPFIQEMHGQMEGALASLRPSVPGK